jgi:hypothetical protein
MQDDTSWKGSSELKRQAGLNKKAEECWSMIGFQEISLKKFILTRTTQSGGPRMNILLYK